VSRLVAVISSARVGQTHPLSGETCAVSNVHYWRQRTSGDHSPIVGRDFNAGLAFREAADAYHEEKAKNAQLYKEIASLKATMKLGTIAFSFICLVLLGQMITVKSHSAAGTATADTAVSAASQEVPATLASGSNPRPASLPCIRGKWVTL
jgi:hypothetical protein